MFELRVQFKFKSVPSGTCWLGMECDGSHCYGYFAKTIFNMCAHFAASLARQRGSRVFISAGGRGADVDVCEPICIVTPMTHEADTLIATPYGKSAPALHGDLEVTPALAKRSIVFDTMHTYTAVWYSLRVNLDTWTIAFPFLSCSISRIFGPHGVNLVIYDGIDELDKHHRTESKRYLFKLTLHPPDYAQPLSS